jgi:DNA-binding CsgD family transcriptional regulator
LNCTVERLAGLLAMQCLVRGSDPGDFAILVPADRALANRLMSRAAELLEEGRAAASPVSLSPRQKEILQALVCNRANKEIASKLNITVRTVKFHISTLLTKFGVSNRSELARRAAAFMRPVIVESVAADLNQRSDDHVHREFERPSLSAALQVASKARHARFPDRTLTA